MSCVWLLAGSQGGLSSPSKGNWCWMAGGQEPRFPLGWGFYRDSQVMSLYSWPWLQHIQAGLKLSKAVPCLGSWDRAGGHGPQPWPVFWSSKRACSNTKDEAAAVWSGQMAWRWSSCAVSQLLLSSVVLRLGYKRNMKTTVRFFCET